MQTRLGHLDFTKATQRFQGVGTPRGRQALHRPHAVIATLQRQCQTTQADFGQRMAGQQAGVHRQQDFGLAHAHFAMRTDPQPIQPQQRTASGPLGLQAIEGNGLAGALTQPRGDLLRPLLGKRQRLAGRTHQQCDRHQHECGGGDRVAAKQTQTAAQRGGH